MNITLFGFVKKRNRCSRNKLDSISEDITWNCIIITFMLYTFMIIYWH